MTDSSFQKILVGLAAIGLTACGGGETATPKATSSPSPASTPATSPVAAKTRTPMERGAILYKRCRACHTLAEGEKHKVGPNLWDIYGATAGVKDGFAYSKAMIESGIVWNDETMDGYIAKPRTFIPGNRMSFAGLKKQEDRDALQLYLKSKTGAE